MNQVVKTESAGTITQISPMQMIDKAIDNGAGVEQLEKLMALQERWEQNNARKAYIEAMNDFKADPPPLYKDKTVKAGQASYQHVSLELATTVIGQALSKYGFSHRWETDQTEEGKVKVSCIITHELGHSEKTTLAAPADTTGSKNNVQAIGSTVTYLQRYTLLAITGLAVKGQDDDGNKLTQITDDQFNEINDLMDKAGANKQLFCQAFGVDSVRNLLAVDFQRAKTQLQQKIKMNGAGNANS